jgi:hypothetical protein
MRKKFIYIIAIVIFSFLILFLLQFINKKNKGGFRREFKSLKVNNMEIFELPIKSRFYSVGNSKTHLYFKNWENLSELFSIDYKLSQLKRMPLNIPIELDPKIVKINFGVVDTTIYVTENQTGRLILISKNTNKREDFSVPNIKFDNTFLISSSSILGRSTTLSESGVGRQLTKVNYRKGEVTKTFLLKKQIDGYFCTDGILNYDSFNSKLFYMYSYRGEFLCLDTNLNLVYKAKTIDTVSTADIKMVSRKNNNNRSNKTTSTLSSPPAFVNRDIMIFQNHIYILSVIKSDEEKSSEFEKNQVVDVYAINNGKYLYSFYIPKYKNLRLKQFRIKDNFIFAVFDGYLIKYKIAPGRIISS